MKPLIIPLPNYGAESIYTQMLHPGESSNANLALSQKDYIEWILGYIKKNIKKGQFDYALITGGGSKGLQANYLEALFAELQNLGLSISTELTPNCFAGQHLAICLEYNVKNILIPIISFDPKIRKDLKLTEINESFFTRFNSSHQDSPSFNVLLAYGFPKENEKLLLDSLRKIIPDSKIRLSMIPFNYYKFIATTKEPGLRIKQQKQIIGTHERITAITDFFGMKRENLYDLASFDASPLNLWKLQFVEQFKHKHTELPNYLHKIDFYLYRNLLLGRINLNHFKREFNLSLNEVFPGLLKNLEKKGLIKTENSLVSITTLGKVFAHNLFQAFRCSKGEMDLLKVS